MGRLTLLDASVLIAVLDPGDAHHPKAVAALRSLSGDVSVPASAYSEILVHPYRRGQDVADQAQRFVHDFPIQVEPVDAQIGRRAASLRARSASLTLGDALVLAAGDVLDADAVLTADSRWPRISPRARVI